MSMEVADTGSSVIRTLRRDVHAASVVVAVAGLAVMVGWLFDIPILKSILPHYVSMKFNTALGFVFAGTALWCLLCEGKWWRELGRALAILVFALGAMSLSEYVWGWDLGIDNLFIQEPPGAVGTAFPGRMSAVTAIAFVLTGISLLPVNTVVGWRLLTSQLLALTVVFLSLLALIGYYYSQSTFFSFGFYSSVALHTSLLFFILGLGVVGTRPHCYIMRHITSEALGGVMARRLIPFAILIPILVGWIHLEWRNGGHEGWRVGESVEVLATILLFVVVILGFAKSLNRTDLNERRMKAKLIEQKSAEKRYQFISAVSHELRSPLAVIQSGIETVVDGVDGPITELQKSHLSTSLHHVDRLNRLVNDVLDFQKMETGRMPFHVEPHDINAIAAGVVQSFRDEAEKKEIVLDLQSDQRLPKVVCDPDAMEQVFTNLLSNAIKYSDHGRVVVKTQMGDDNMVRVTVSDDGIGIKKEDQEKLFHSFYRIETPGRPRSEGTGLGLAICKKIIDACHGKIGVESEFGHGSTFYFVLPTSH